VLNSGPDFLVGPVTVNVFASTDGVISAGDDLAVGQVVKNVKLKPGAAKALKVKVQIPAPPQDGDYLLLAEVSGAGAGGAAVTGAGPAVRIEKPFVNLVGQAGPEASLAFGKQGRVSLPVLNAGNVGAKGKANLELFVSMDGTLEPGRSFPLGTLGAVKVSAKPGATRPLKLKLVVPPEFPDAFGPGSYFLVAELSAVGTLGDLNVSDGDLLGAVPFTIE
jgi:hypothetical protein